MRARIIAVPASPILGDERCRRRGIRKDRLESGAQGRRVTFDVRDLSANQRRRRPRELELQITFEESTVDASPIGQRLQEIVTPWRRL